jgi:hypothetical protein
MQRRKACKARIQENLTMLGLGFLSEIIMNDKPKISINKDLGGLGGWLVGCVGS